MAAGFVEGRYLDYWMSTRTDENGFDLPNAWVCQVRSDLIELNIGVGYVAGVMEKFKGR